MAEESVKTNSALTKEEKKNLKEAKKEALAKSSDYRSAWWGILCGFVSIIFLGMLFIPAATISGVINNDGSSTEAFTINLFQAFFGFDSQGTTFIGLWWTSALVVALVFVGGIFYCFMSNSLFFGIIGCVLQGIAELLLILFGFGPDSIRFSLKGTEAENADLFENTVVKFGAGYYVAIAFIAILILLGIAMIIVTEVTSKRSAVKKANKIKVLENY